MSERDVLVVGNLRGASRSALATALKGLPLVATELSDIEQAISSLLAKPWAAILVDTTVSGASRFCGEARATEGLIDTPLIALTPRLTDLAFLNALRWGADDVVALGAAEPLSTRLANVTAARPHSKRTIRGRAVVADTDARRGDALKRALHSAGYDVHYAADKASARAYAFDPEVDLYVLVADMAEPRQLIEEARRNGCNGRWVVLTKPQRADELEQQLTSLRSVVVMSAAGPPENVLFAVNLLYPSEASRRGEVRALFGTVVLFRAVGEYRDECGFSYTASPQGLYIRTLAPTPTEKVWIELIPPDGERRVRLVGKVAWNRAFGSDADEAAPPGFGVQIVDGLGEDLALWSECLSRLEFRAPATLVPEARFSVPSYKVPVPSPTPVSHAGPVSLARHPESVRLSDLGPGRVRISTRPPLRLSVPSPTHLSNRPPGSVLAPQKKSLLRSQPSPSIPSLRSAAGRTVMGLGLLNRDGSVSPDARPEPPRSPEQATTVLGSRPISDAEPPVSEQVASDPFEAAASSFPPRRGDAPPDAPVTPRVNVANDSDRIGENADTASPTTITGTGIPPRMTNSPIATTVDPSPAPHPKVVPQSPTQLPNLPEALRLSPVTGRTLVYGSSAPPPPFIPGPAPTPKARVTGSTTLVTESVSESDESERDQGAGPEDISDRPTLADHNAVSLDSLPPGVLESDTPRSAVEKNHIGRRPPPLPVTRRSSTELVAATAEHVPLISETSFGVMDTPHVNEIPDPVAPADPSVEPSIAMQPAADSEPSSDPNEAPPTAPSHSPKVESTGATQAFRQTGLSPSEPASVFADEAEPTAKRLVPKPATPKQRAPWLAIAATLALAVIVLIGVRSKSDTARETKALHSQQQAAETIAGNTPAAEVSLAKPAAEPERAVNAKQPRSVASHASDQPSTRTPPVVASETQTTTSAAPIATAASPGFALPEPEEDPQSLAPKTGLLFVRSVHETRVFLHGVDSGATNVWLTVPCGTRFLRLGSAPGRWVSDGFATAIRCRATNSIDLVE